MKIAKNDENDQLMIARMIKNVENDQLMIARMIDYSIILNENDRLFYYS